MHQNGCIKQLKSMVTVAIIFYGRCRRLSEVNKKRYFSVGHNKSENVRYGFLQTEESMIQDFNVKKQRKIC